MKRRIVTLVSILCLLIALPLVFGACSAKHQHSFSNMWENDDTHHWHSATCEHTSETADKAEHTWGEGVVILEPTATEEGTLQYTCTVCGRTKISVIPSNGHQHAWNDGETIAPTCTEKGYTLYTCSCGETRRDGETDALGHQVSSWTAGADGVHTGFCSREQKNVSEACVYSATVTAPLCTEQGYTTYSCACGDSYRDNYTAALGHAHGQTLQYNDVYHWYVATCSHTNEKLEYALHTFVETVTAPTCTEQGYTTYACACGYSYKASFVAATGHTVDTWVEGSTTLYDASNCKSAVAYHGECSVCSEEQTKTEYVEKHSFYWEITTPATCLGGEGVKTKLCNNEGCKYHTASSLCETETFTDEAAHKWVIDTNASTNAVTVQTCEHGCGEIKKTINVGDSTVNVGNQDLNDANELEFTDVTLGFDEDVKQNLGNLAGNSQINISAGKLGEDAKQDAIEDAELSEEDRALLGDNPIYSFVITGSSNQEIDQLGGTATVRIPYTLTPGQNPEQIVVWYIADGTLQAVPATYGVDANGNGYVSFTTTHFSHYVPAELTPKQYCFAFGHSDHVLTVAPTCTEWGYTICLHCGEQIASARPVGHNIHSAVSVAPSCDVNGTMHFSCDGCDLAYDAAIPATGHYYVLGDHVNATCQAAGKDTYGCVFCDDEYDVTLPQLNHNHTTTVVAATCTSAGYTQKLCKQCGDTVVLNYTQPLAHSFATAWSTSEAGHSHICTVCGASDELRAHTPGAEATEESAQICTECEYVITPPKAHVHTLTAVAAATPDCTHGGNLAYYTCTCGKWFLDENAQQLVTDRTAVYLLATGHTPVSMDPVTPTCEEVGYTAGIKCSTCQEILKGHNEISPYGHRHAATVTAPTCTTGGKTVYTCACGDTYEADPTEALGHKLVSSVTAPTCTADGYTTHSCTRCDHTYTDSQVGALGHDPSMILSHDDDGHWIACRRCATRLMEGEHTPDYAEATTEHGITCTLCGHVLEDVVPHTHTVAKTVDGKPATCTSSGVKPYYVCGCGKWFEDEACTKEITDLTSVVLPMAGHTGVEVPATESTCEEHGYTAGIRCSVCEKWVSGHKKLPLGEHTYENGTCTACGDVKPIYVYQEDFEGGFERLEFFANFTVRDYWKDQNNEDEAWATWRIENELIVVTYQGRDVLWFEINADGTLTSTEPPKAETKYVYEETENEITFKYEFLIDFTVYATMTDGTNTAVQTAKWAEKDGFILILNDAGEEFARFTVNEDGKTLTRVEETVKKIQYSYYGPNAGGDEVLFEFYTDGSAYGALLGADGKVEDEVNGTWEAKDGKILMTVGEETFPLFTINPDNSLTPYEGETPDQPGGETVRLLYRWETVIEDWNVAYLFYENYVVNIFMEKVLDDGTVDKMQNSIEWKYDGDEIVCVYEGQEGYRFTDNGDGTLTLVNGGSTEPDEPNPDEPEDRKVQYVCEIKDEYGAVYSYVFYDNYTVVMSVSMIDQDGKEISYTFDANWRYEDDEIVIEFEGEDGYHFADNGDGTLTRIENTGLEIPEDREILYVWEQPIDGMTVRYEFCDNDLLAIFVISADGQVSSSGVNWRQDGKFLIPVIEGEDVGLIFEIGEDGKTLTLVESTTKEIVYLYEGIEEGVKIRFEFYSDGTLTAIATNSEGETMTRTERWVKVDNELCIVGEDENVPIFTIGEDGKTLTPIKGEDNPNQPNPDEPSGDYVYRFEETTATTYLYYNFYSDFRIYAYAKRLSDGYSSSTWANWEWDGDQIVIVYNGNVVERFDVNEDNSLTRAEGTTDPDEPGDSNVQYVYSAVIDSTRIHLVFYKEGKVVGTFEYPDGTGTNLGGKWWYDEKGIVAELQNGAVLYFTEDAAGNLTLIGGGNNEPDQPNDPETPQIPDPNKEIAYSYSTTEENRLIKYYLYSDFTGIYSFEWSESSDHYVVGWIEFKWFVDGEELVLEELESGSEIGRFTVDENGDLTPVLGGEPNPPAEKTPKYEFETVMDGVYMLLYFYEDMSVYAFARLPGGSVTEATMEWCYDGKQIVLIYMGEEDSRYEISDDGYTLISTDGIPEEGEVVYEFELDEGSDYLYMEFYDNHTVLIYLESRSESGEILDEATVYADWSWSWKYIVVYHQNEAMMYFEVDENGELVLVPEDEVETPELGNVIHTYEMSFDDVHITFEFYEGYRVRIFAQALDGDETQETWASWVMENGMLAVLENGEVIIRFSINENGELTPEFGMEEERQPVHEYHAYYSDGSYFDVYFYSDFTMLVEGFEGDTYEKFEGKWCYENGNEIAVYDNNGKEQMRFTVNADGSLTPKGGSSTPEGPDHGEIRYFFEMTVSSVQVVFEFYTNGRVFGQIVEYDENGNISHSMEGYFDWIIEDGIVKIIDGGRAMFRFTVSDDDYNLIYIEPNDPETCPHENSTNDYREPTCTEEGMDSYYCEDCQSGWGSVTPALGHEFGEDGLCIRCKLSQEEIGEELRKNIESARSMMNDGWNKYLYNTDLKNLENFIMFENEFHSLMKSLDAVTSVADVDKILDHFNELMNEIERALNENPSEDGKLDSIKNSHYNEMNRLWNEIQCEKLHELEAYEFYVQETERLRNLIWEATSIDEANEIFSAHLDYINEIRDLLGMGGGEIEKTVVYTYNDATGYDFTFYSDGTVDITITEYAADGSAVNFYYSSTYGYDDAGFLKVSAANSIYYFLVWDDHSLTLDHVESFAIDLDIYIQNKLSQMEYQWMRYQSYEGFASVGAMYQNQYDALYEQIAKSTSIAMVDSYFAEVQNMMKDIEKMLGVGGGEGSDEAVSLKIESATSEMDRIWGDYCSNELFHKLGLKEVYQKQFDNYYNKIKKASTLAEIDNTYHMFEKMCSDIDAKMKNAGEEPEVSVDALIMEIREWMFAEWYAWQSNGLFTMSDAYTYYEGAFNAHLAAVEGAVTVEELYSYRNDIQAMFAEMSERFNCTHGNYTIVDSMNSTCTMNGYANYTCNDCGTTWSETLPLLGHSYDENGNCTVCGASESENMDALRSDLTKNLVTGWRKLQGMVKQFGSYDEYSKRYEEIFQWVESATSMDELKKCSAAIDQFFADIEKLIQSGETACQHYNYEIRYQSQGNCVTQGEIDYGCLDCGEGWVEYTGFGDHVINERGCCDFCDHCTHLSVFAEKMTDATCQQQGDYALTCEVCGMREYYSVPRLEHTLDEKGHCSSCGIPQASVKYRFELWNNTNQAVQSFVFYENGSFYAYMASYKFESFGELLVEDWIEGTWIVEGEFLHFRDVDGNELGMFRINEDGSLSMEGSGEDVYVQYMFSQIIDDQDITVEFFSDGSATLNIVFIMEGYREKVDTTWFEQDGKVYLHFDGSLLTFIICADGSLEMEDGSGDVGGDVVLPDVPVNPPIVNPDLPTEPVLPEFNYDFQGEKIDILLNANAATNWDMMESDDFSSAVSMAVYARNCRVEEMLNVSLDFTAVDSAQFANFLNDQTLSGMTTFDLVSYGASAVMPFVMQGTFKDLKSSEYLDLNASWWNESYNAAAGMFDKQFTLVGDLNLAAYDLLSAIYVNIDMFENWGLSEMLGMSLYELVLNGEWTLEQLRMLSETVYNDMDGDGVIGADDSFGLIGSNHGSMDAFRIACGVELAIYDEAKNTMVLQASERAMNAMDSLNELWKENVGAYRFTTLVELYTRMATGTALFMVDTLDRNHGALTSNFVDSGMCYGILPMPKMDLEQVAYTSSVAATHNVIALMDNSQAVCVTLDAMSAYSASEVLPAYENYLMRGAADSEMARDVLSVVLDSAAWDYLAVYNSVLGSKPNEDPVTLLWVNPFVNDRFFMSNFSTWQGQVQYYFDQLEVLLKH